MTVCTAVKSKVMISQNFVAFSEYMNFIVSKIRNELWAGSKVTCNMCEIKLKISGFITDLKW